MKAIEAEQVVPWARRMARMLCRQLTITNLTGLSPAVIREVWQAENSRSSPSGMLPSDLFYHLKTPDIRYQSALLIMLHQQTLKLYPQEVAFTHAYFHFANMTSGEWQRRRSFDGAFRSAEDDYKICFQRGFHLVSTYTDELDNTGNRKCELKIRKCKCCSGIFMSHINEISGKCPSCD